MARGRPVGSNVRQNMIEILYFLKSAHGYHIYKMYRELYPKITLRAIYYHLRKGSDLQEFKVDNIKREGGNYSWGTEAEKIYYKLGPNANPKMDERVKLLLDSKPELSTRD